MWLQMIWQTLLRKRANSWMTIAKGLETLRHEIGFSLTVMLHGLCQTSYSGRWFDGPTMQYHAMPFGQNIPELTPEWMLDLG